MAPEPGQHHTKSPEITLQVHFTASMVLRKILTLPWTKNPDTAAGRILRKQILTWLWQLAELGNCDVRIPFSAKNPAAGDFARNRMPCCPESNDDALHRGVRRAQKGGVHGTRFWNGSAKLAIQI